MLIAVLSNASTYSSMIPERYEDAACLWIMESDGMYPESVYTKTPDDPDLFQREIINYNVEAVVCGVMTEHEFEPIAGAAITRFNGSGLTVEESVRAAIYNALPYITDFENGSGCPSNSQKTECAHHALQMAI